LAFSRLLFLYAQRFPFKVDRSLLRFVLAVDGLALLMAQV
jgi:hypothetical protein